MHEKWMYKALQLAYLYKGTTSPNPTVGAVFIDKNGKYIDSSVTQPAGQFHAERNLLVNLPIKITQGGTLYVTLEPCCFYGKTPPCTDIIIEKKISKVIVATLDPHPKVAGKGVELLKKAGVLVEIGCLEQKALTLNQDFFYATKHQRPFVFAKVALSLDGCMATHNGHSQWISHARARRLSHILRYRADAILVGAHTVIQDNPTLNARLYCQEKPLYRVILDRNAKVPLDVKVLSDKLPTLWVVDSSKKKELSIKTVLSRENKEIFFLEPKKGLEELLDFLYHSQHIISLMVEGGSTILGQFMEYKLLRMIFIFYGHMFLGNGLKPFPMDISSVPTAPVLQDIQIKKLQDQFLVFGNLQ